jgi:hypothetical protein
LAWSSGSAGDAVGKGAVTFVYKGGR